MNLNYFFLNEYIMGETWRNVNGPVGLAGFPLFAVGASFSTLSYQFNGIMRCKRGHHYYQPQLVYISK